MDFELWHAAACLILDSGYSLSIELLSFKWTRKRGLAVRAIMILFKNKI